MIGLRSVSVSVGVSVRKFFWRFLEISWQTPRNKIREVSIGNKEEEKTKYRSQESSAETF